MLGTTACAETDPAPEGGQETFYQGAGADRTPGSVIVEPSVFVIPYYVKPEERLVGLADVSVYDENWGGILEHPFVRTEEAATATFTAYADTVSYPLFRNYFGYRYTPEQLISAIGRSVRTEEMINYFDYDNAEPEDGELFGVKAQIAPCPWNGETTLLKLNLKAEDAAPSKGSNLVFLLDVSGSMANSAKLSLLKQAFAYLSEGLTAQDTVSILTYAGQEAVLLDGCPGDRTDQILAAVEALAAEGARSVEGGLPRAYELAAKHYIEGGNNRVILASDGDLNVGLSSPDAMIELISTGREQDLYLTTLGFGGANYRNANMNLLAEYGDGEYYYIADEIEARRIFGGELLRLRNIVAEDVRIELTFDPRYVAQYRPVGYEHRLLDIGDYEDDGKDAGEIRAGQAVTVCYELVLTEDAIEASGGVELMELTVRHRVPGADFTEFDAYPILRRFHTTAPDDEFRFVASVAELSMILHRSPDTSVERIAEINRTLSSLSLEDADQRAFREIVKDLADR